MYTWINSKSFEEKPRKHLKRWVLDKNSFTHTQTLKHPHYLHITAHLLTPLYTPMYTRTHPRPPCTPAHIHTHKYPRLICNTLLRCLKKGRRRRKKMTKVHVNCTKFFEKSILNDNFLLSYSTTPKTSPNKPGSLRARRTGKFGFFSNNSLYLLEFHSLKSLHIIILSKKLKCGQHIDQFKN